MAGSTITGLDEHRAAVSALPEKIRAASRSVAMKSAQSIRNDAARRLRDQQKTDATALANMIEVTDRPDENRVVVTSNAPGSQPANLPIWMEYGTVKMAARPYMIPATKAEESRYQAEMQRVVDQVTAGALA